MALGAAARAGAVPRIADYVYPALWWGALLLIDAWNERRRGLTLWSAQTFVVLLPVSVLFWLYFEALNLASPQWRYAGGLRSPVLQTVFGFIAFATVIPITVEFWWAVAGPVCVPVRLRHAGPALITAAVLTAIPFFNHVFWWNQGMWLAPAIALLPFAPARSCGPSGSYVARLIAAALLMGFVWECFNYGARTHWEYLILPSAPHLFEMPVPGYVGFIPFMAAGHVIFEWQRRIPPRPVVAMALYAVALVGLWALTVRYLEVGLWRIAS